MDQDLHLYWGDMHTNIHHRHMGTLDDTFEAARANLDFFPVAYYPFYYYSMPGGLAVESIGQRDQFLEDWDEILAATARYYQPGSFVTFPGYEWHGDRRFFGDHNVFYYDRGPLTAAVTLPHLYSHLRRTRGIAIPHHTAYNVGERGKDWEYQDDALSPFAEIYSSHGSSEGCNTPLGMDSNMDMGPRVGGGSIQDGLEHGHRIGIMASGDSHTGYPGPWGTGLMGLYARELTREAIWEAFMARRLYGVTGDRIRLDFRLNGHLMGSELAAKPPLQFDGRVVGSAPIDRIELLRDNRVVQTYCHAGTWEVLEGTDACRFKVRVECGWGISPMHGVESEPKVWEGHTRVDGGHILGCEGLFTTFGQHWRRESDQEYSWQLTTLPRQPGVSNTQGLVFEIEASRSDHIRLNIGEEELSFHVSEALRRSRVEAFLQETRPAIEKLFQVAVTDIENRGDVFWHNAYKMKVHLAVPRAAYDVPYRFVEEQVPPGRHWYYLRVSQTNGQMAWSSPIWVDVP